MKSERTSHELEARGTERMLSPYEREREVARIEERHAAAREVERREREIAREVNVSELDDRPSRELVSELMGEAQNLIRGEVELARAELREVKTLARGVGLSAGIAVVSAFVALLLAATTIVALLSLVLPVWAAALITFALFGIVAAVTGLEAQSRVKRMREAPKETVSTLKEDARWLKRTVELIKTHRQLGHA